MSTNVGQVAHREQSTRRPLQTAFARYHWNCSLPLFQALEQLRPLLNGEGLQTMNVNGSSDYEASCLEYDAERVPELTTGAVLTVGGGQP